jgi:hypothetical protein
MKVLSWVQLVLGLWVLVSPWAMGFADLTAALWSNVIVGALIVIFSLWQLFGGKSSSAGMPQMPQAPQAPQAPQGPQMPQ